MRLHQIRLDYDSEQDRLLLRISTDDGKEVLLWLTRRCVRLLWGLLIDMAQSNPKIALQNNPEARAAMLGFEHEQALRGTDFSRPYDEIARERPLGSEPLLVVRIARSMLDGGDHLLTLAPTKGQQIDLTLDDRLLHAFCRLLQKVVSNTDWGLTLSLPRGIVQDSEPAVRTIN